MTTQALAVNFHGTDLFIVDHNGQPYTPMKIIVEAMKLDWSSQLAKLNSNPERWGIVKIIIPTLGDMQEAVCLPLRKLFGWLGTISPNKVKPELRDTIIYYQNECDDVLWNYWQSKKQTPYGLKPLAPSPYITEAQAQQFKKSMEAHCESNGATYPLLCRKVYDHFGVTSDKNIPRGKLEEAARLIGIKLVAAQKAALPPEPSGLSFTPDGLEGLVAERIKALPAPAPPEGGVMPKQQHNSATLNLAPLENRNPKRWLVTQARNEMVVMNALGDDVEVRTREQLIKELRQDNHVVSERTAHGVRSMVMDHLPIQVMPAILEAAATRMQRCNWQMPA